MFGVVGCCHGGFSGVKARKSEGKGEAESGKEEKPAAATVVDGQRSRGLFRTTGMGRCDPLTGISPAPPESSAPCCLPRTKTVQVLGAGADAVRDRKRRPTTVRLCCGEIPQAPEQESSGARFPRVRFPVWPASRLPGAERGPTNQMRTVRRITHSGIETRPKWVRPLPVRATLALGVFEENGRFDSICSTDAACNSFEGSC